MKILFFKFSIFVLGATALASITSCQSKTSAGPTLPIEMTSTPSSSVEAPVQTPSSTPDHQIETDNADNPYDPFLYEIVDGFSNAQSEKLSGIVFYPPRETLFAVSDNGWIIEIKTNGTFIQKKQIRKKADFEGITYSPATGMLYVAIEGKEVILEINPETLEAERDFPIDRIFEGNILLPPEGNGLEGIPFVPASDGTANGSFYLVNQSKELGGTDPSIVFEVEINDAGSEPYARIMRYFSVGVTDLSGIHYSPSSRRLLVISDANNLLLEVGLSGQVLKTSLLPGKNQEGISTDADGFLYIAQDRKEALLKFTPLNNASDTEP